MQHSSKFTVDDDILATHGQRIANYLLDYLMQIILMFGVFIVYVFIAAFNGQTENDIVETTEHMSKIGQYTIGLVVVLVYYNFFEILFSRTIGKFITKTVVVDEFGEKPTANAILLRSICRVIPLEFVTFLGTPPRGWHDRLSNTYVVQTELLENKRKSFHSFNEIGNQQSEI
ncbi:RDD family protein [Flavobacterium sp. 3HN19-14]|uniref:RDD family protein n=1 Tax=Flavobacterium sp. 3HN19-14 TaxID=3448133 RepID=UPI003EDEC03E